MTNEPPNSPDAELGILGSILIEKGVPISECQQWLNPECFYSPVNRQIYEVMLDVYEKRKPLDLISFTQELRDRNLLEKLGGASYVTNLFTFVPTASNVMYYIDIVRDKFILRQVIANCNESIIRSYQEQDDVQGLLSKIHSDFIKIEEFGQMEDSDPVLSEAIDKKIERMDCGTLDENVIKTGLSDLDRHSPLKKGDMPLIMGKRKSGKSILALTVALNVAQTNKRVVIFSLESPTHEIVDRLTASITRIPLWKNASTKLSSDEKRTFLNRISKLRELPIMIYDNRFELGQIVAKLRYLKRKYKDLGMAVVDYAQLVRGMKGIREGNREQEVANVSRTLRLLAMELNIPILVLSQLNQFGESRESRSLEQDATAGWKLDFDEDSPKDRSLYIPWQRNGESGVSIGIAFLGEISRIENLARVSQDLD